MLQSVRFAAKSSTVKSAIKSFSTVMDNSIKITFVDERGGRRTVPALAGQSLLECADIHNIGLNGSCQGWGPSEIQRTEKWTELTWGSGAHCFHCHVQIDPKYDSILPKIPEKDVAEFKIHWEEEYQPSSRLACSIILDKVHDGMVVLVPDAPPVDLI